MSKILIIDDEQICIDSVSMMLNGGEFNVIAATSGQEGLNIIDNDEDISLILLDLMLLDMHGKDVLRKLKGNPKRQHLPVIIQTGCFNEHDINDCMNLGAAHCIFKPYKRDPLIEAIRKVLKKN